MAALLSFLWPGLGEWYAGYPRRALLFALPVLAVAIVFGLQLLGGAANLALGLLTPSTALTVAFRPDPLSSATSPKYCPGPSVARTCSSLPVRRTTSTFPALIM